MMTASDSSTARYDFTPSPDAAIRIERVGQEQQPLLIIDGALRDPESLRTCAAREVRFESVAGNFYPGVRALCPADYVHGILRALDPLIRRIWQLDTVMVRDAECFLSIVTTPPEQLAPQQRVPHIDTTDSLQFAALHFLCGPEGGGTALYRQRATGYEAITPGREGNWERARDAALARDGGPAGYIAGDDPDYEEIAFVGAQFNRLIVYRSNQLHSGRILPDMALDPDPEKGRLTANLFIGYRPAG